MCLKASGGDALAEAQVEEALIATDAQEASTAAHRAPAVRFSSGQDHVLQQLPDPHLNELSDSHTNSEATTSGVVEAAPVSALRSNSPIEELSDAAQSKYLEQMEAEILAAETSLNCNKLITRFRKSTSATPVSRSPAAAEVDKLHELSAFSQEGQEAAAAAAAAADNVDIATSSSAETLPNLTSGTSDLPDSQSPALSLDATSACEAHSKGSSSSNDAEGFLGAKSEPITADFAPGNINLLLPSDQSLPPPPPPPRRSSSSSRHQLAKQRLKDRARARSLAPSSAGKPSGLKRRKKRKALPRPLSAPPSTRPRPVLEPVLEVSDEEKDESASSEGDPEGHHLAAAPLLSSWLHEHAQKAEAKCTATGAEREAVEVKENLYYGNKVDGCDTSATPAAAATRETKDNEAQVRAARIAAVQASDLAAREAAYAAETARIAATTYSSSLPHSPEIAYRATDESASQVTGAAPTAAAAVVAVPAELRAVAGQEGLSALRERLLALESTNHTLPSSLSSSSSSYSYSSSPLPLPLPFSTHEHTISCLPPNQLHIVPSAAADSPVPIKPAPKAASTPETASKSVSSVVSPTRTLIRRRRTSSAPPASKNGLNGSSGPSTAPTIRPMDGNNGSSASSASFTIHVIIGAAPDVINSSTATAAVVIDDTPAVSVDALPAPVAVAVDVTTTRAQTTSLNDGDEQTLLELARIPDGGSSIASICSSSDGAPAAAIDSADTNTTATAVAVAGASPLSAADATDANAPGANLLAEAPVVHTAPDSHNVATAKAQRREARRMAKEARQAARSLARSQARATKALHKAMLKGMVGMGPPTSAPPHRQVGGNNDENAYPRTGLDEQTLRTEDGRAVQVKWRPVKQPASGLWALPPLPPDPPPPELLAAPRPPRPPLAPRTKVKKPRPPAFGPPSFPPPSRDTDAHNNHAVAAAPASVAVTVASSAANTATPKSTPETIVAPATAARKLIRRKKSRATSDSVISTFKVTPIEGTIELQACTAWVREWRVEDANAVRVSSTSRLVAHLERSLVGSWQDAGRETADQLAQKVLSDWFADFGHLASALEEREEKGVVSVEDLLQPQVQALGGGYLDWCHGEASNYNLDGHVGNLGGNPFSSHGFLEGTGCEVFDSSTSNNSSSSNTNIDLSPFHKSGASQSALSEAALSVVRQEALFAFRCHRLDGAIPLLLDESSSLAATKATTTDANLTKKSPSAERQAPPAPAAAVAAVLRYLRSGETGLEARSSQDKPPPQKLVKAISMLAERSGIPDLVAWCQRVTR